VFDCMCNTQKILCYTRYRL